MVETIPDIVRGLRRLAALLECHAALPDSRGRQACRPEIESTVAERFPRWQESVDETVRTMLDDVLEAIVCSNPHERSPSPETRTNVGFGLECLAILKPAINLLESSTVATSVGDVSPSLKPPPVAKRKRKNSGRPIGRPGLGKPKTRADYAKLCVYWNIADELIVRPTRSAKELQRRLAESDEARKLARNAGSSISLRFVRSALSWIAKNPAVATNRNLRDPKLYPPPQTAKNQN